MALAALATEGAVVLARQVSRSSFEPMPRADTRRWFGNWIAKMVVRRVLLAPLNFVPFVGLAISAWFRALGTGKYLHTPVSGQTGLLCFVSGVRGSIYC